MPINAFGFNRLVITRYSGLGADADMPIRKSYVVVMVGFLLRIQSFDHIAYLGWYGGGGGGIGKSQLTTKIPLSDKQTEWTKGVPKSD